MQQYADKVLDGTVKREDLELASHIASGSLQSDAVVEGLVRSFVAKIERQRQGKVIRTNSSANWNEQAALEFMFSIGKSPESLRLLQSLSLYQRCLLSASIHCCFCLTTYTNLQRYSRTPAGAFYKLIECGFSVFQPGSLEWLSPRPRLCGRRFKRLSPSFQISFAAAGRIRHSRQMRARFLRQSAWQWVTETST